MERDCARQTAQKAKKFHTSSRPQGMLVRLGWYHVYYVTKLNETRLIDFENWIHLDRFSQLPKRLDRMEKCTINHSILQQESINHRRVLTKMSQSEFLCLVRSH